jgi:RNA polymerase sigma-70 factor, ECF subfamily
MVTDDEGILIARSRNGDWDAFAELVRTHQRMIHSLAYRMSGSMADADDLAQETFIRAFRGLDSYRGAAKFSSWLYRIALNVCLRWRKLERRRGLTDHEWMGESAAGRGTDEQIERVQEALNLLSPKQRAAVILTVFEGMTHAEAATLLGCAETTLSWRLFSARRQLAKLLKDEVPTQ